MPHAIIDYSGNAEAALTEGEVVAAVHRTMIESGLFQPHDVKTRAYPSHSFLVGEKGAAGRFVHLTVHLLAGRTAEQQQGLSTALMTTLTAKLPQIDSLSVELCELNQNTYRKRAA